MKFIPVIFLQLIFLSCREKKSEKPSLWDAEEYKPNVNDTIQQPTSDWDKFEAEVFQSIDSIKTSTLTNRKERIEKFLSYSEKTDGAVAEAYFLFAYQYPTDKKEDFFSVFNEADTVLLNTWAKLAATDLSNAAFNMPEEKDLIKNYDKEFKQESTKLHPKEKALALWYLEKMITYSIAE